MNDLVPVRLYEFKNISLISPMQATAFYGPDAENGALVVETDLAARLKRKTPHTHRGLFTPLGFQIPDKFYVPGYDVDSVRFDNRYDERTTIFWKPVLELKPGEPAEISFYTADTPGTYSVTLEGITSSGLPFRKSLQLQVK